METRKFDYSKQELTTFPSINEGGDLDLIELILEENNINYIDNIPDNCLSLNLSRNKISNLSKLENQTKSLKILDLSINRLISLSGCEMLPNLKELNISNNYLGDEGLIHLKPLIKLKYLNLSNNNFKQNTITVILPHLPKLEKLLLSNNNYESLEFPEHPRLSHLEIDMNKLRYIAFSGKNEKLLFLNLTNNPLEDISFSENISNLKDLNLTENSISNPIFLLKLKCLKNLFLGHNNLSNYNISFTPSEQWFQKIENLDISYNNFTSFTLSENFPRLNKLNLEHNRIANIVIKTPSLSLEYINFSNNQLENISSIKTLTNIKYLDLSFNRLESLTCLLNVIKNLIFLEEINLTQNSFNKDFIAIVNQTIDCVSKLPKQLEIESFMNYRGLVIKSLRSRIKILDNIMISEYEREQLSALKLDNINEINSSKIQASEIDAYRRSQEILNESLRSRKSVKSDKKDNSIINLNKNHIDNKDNISVIGKTTRNGYKEILTENSHGNTNNQILKKENSFNNTYKDNKPQIPLPQKTLSFRVKQSIPKINERYRNVYTILKKTISKLADPNGFIEIFNLKLFFADLKKYYKNIDNLDYIINEADRASYQSIFPNKVHLNDFSKIMKTDQFYSVYEALLITINNKNSGYNNNQSFRNSSRQNSRRESKNNNTPCVDVDEINIYRNSNSKNSQNLDINSNAFDHGKEEMKLEYKDLGKRSLSNKNNQIEYDSHINSQIKKTQSGLLNQIMENNNQNNYFREKINTGTKFKTPHLKNKEIIKGSTTSFIKEDIQDSMLFSSFYHKESELLSNEDLLISLIQCIRIPLFPLKYSQYTNTFTYKLSDKHKEFKLLKHFFKQFDLVLTQTIKYFCLEKQENYFSSKETEITEALLLFDTPDIKTDIKMDSRILSENPLCLFDNPLKASEKIRKDEFFMDIHIANSNSVINFNRMNCENNSLNKNYSRNVFYDENEDKYFSYSQDSIVHVYRVRLENNKSIY